MKFFSYFLVLAFTFSKLSTSAERLTAAEKCRGRRLDDNENSLHGWRLSHPASGAGVNDDALKVIMTAHSLEAINRTIFESFDKPRTAILDLSINRISEIENEAFRSLPNLRILTLRINNLRRIHSTTFGGLMRLEELDLSRNMISDMDRDAFRIMLNLHTIDLSENCMFQLPNYIFFRNVRLHNIFLKRNHLASLPVLMPTQQFIESFNASENAFTNLTSFSQYNNIQSLDLSNNPLDPEEMSASLADVAKDHDSSDDDESDENDNNNYLHVKYATDAKYNYIPSSNRSQSPEAVTQHTGRYSNRRDRIDFSPDMNFIASGRARTNAVSPVREMNNSPFNRNLEFLMDSFRPNRMSEEALESLIKTTMEKKSEDFKVTDMIQVFNPITNFYRNQNRRVFMDEMEKIKRNDENFSVASFLQFLQDLIKNQTTSGSRTLRHTSQKRSQLTPEQLQLLIKATRTNHLEYFTCRNCSLQSVDFLVNYPELKYVDVSSNKIKTVNEEQLGKALPNMRYLLVSDNAIESLNFTIMLRSWSNFRALIVNNNPSLNCDLIAQMQYKAAHLTKMFKLEVNKCK